MVSAAFSFAERVQVSKGNFLYLIKGSNGNRPLWHYVLVDKLKLPIFEKKVQSDFIDVADYGEVIESGWGNEPPAHIKEKIIQQYS